MRVVNKYKQQQIFFLLTTENTMPVNFSETQNAVEFFLNEELNFDFEAELQAELDAEMELELCL